MTTTNNKLKHLCLDRTSRYPDLRAPAGLQTNWKPRELEHGLRVSHDVALLLSGYLNAGDHVIWVSDEDALFASSSHTDDMGRMLTRFLGYYFPTPLGSISLGTTAIDPGDRGEEDLASIADLAAGSLSEATNRLPRQCGPRISSVIAMPLEQPLTEKTELIADWFWHPRGSLRRVAVLFEGDREGYTVSRHSMGYR